MVVDGNLVTSRYPMDLPYFLKELIKLDKAGWKITLLPMLYNFD